MIVFYRTDQQDSLVDDLVSQRYRSVVSLLINIQSTVPTSVTTTDTDLIRPDKQDIPGNDCGF